MSGFIRPQCLICASTIVVHVISGTKSAIVKTDFHEPGRTTQRVDCAASCRAWVNLDLKFKFHIL
jgi:hypothetical protein